MTNFGQPDIVVEDSDFNEYLYQLWGRPVHLETRQGEKTVILTCQADGVQRIEV